MLGSGIMLGCYDRVLGMRFTLASQLARCTRWDPSDCGDTRLELSAVEGASERDEGLTKPIAQEGLGRG